MSETDFKRHDADGPVDGAGGDDMPLHGDMDPQILELQQSLAQAQAQFNEAQQKYLRTLADYQNSQKRAINNEQEARTQARSSLVQQVLSVVDHFDLALTQDPTKATADQIISGVKVIRDELMRVLQANGVGLISPAPGEEFTPGRHEAIMQQAAQGVASGHVVATFQTGYTIQSGNNERVIRPAKVSVAP